jgi:hypothetical protein
MERMMYNTVLGAKPLQENGRAFYYSDYNFDSKRVYHEARWPCCSGTLPQVAADYRINTYFRGPRAVYVNLYIPSTLRWADNGATLSLTQEGAYPYQEDVSVSVTSSRPTEQSLYFRIPEWADHTAIYVNGTRQKELAVPGRFAAIRREWRTGDRIDLALPLRMRLEPIGADHPDTVALLRGPLVLMAVKESEHSRLPRVTRRELLSPSRVSEREWRVGTATTSLPMMPFTSLGELPYTTYLTVERERNG